MIKRTAGIDVGSSAVKCVIIDESSGNPKIVGRAVERIRRRSPADVASECYDSALAQAGLDREQIGYVATTGEGEAVDFRTGHFFSMTAHARGALFLEPRARAVLDIGALHGRAILMDDRSRVLAYRMTSQCASGTGQFLENIARYLGVAIDEIGELSCSAEKPEKCSSICAVLAETDVINMVSRGIKIPDILKGIHLSMGGRFVKLLLSTKATGCVLLTGGLAADCGLLAAVNECFIQEGENLDVRTHPDSIHAGALGAALWGSWRARVLAERGALV